MLVLCGKDTTVRMRTQSHVCENPISSFVRSTSILHGNPQCLPHTQLFSLWNNYARLKQCLCLVIHPTNTY